MLMTRPGIDTEIWRQQLRKELSRSLPGQSFTVLTALFGHASPIHRDLPRPRHLRNYVDTRS